MKYLNKIIFIYSANIPYAEISVDGNVHFTGTQGVGKSTLLRALLFFYNADTQHLGINREQKSFEEFYFPRANSYILYEVMRENGAYTILVNSKGGIKWRFIDAPYQKEWLIDESNRVLSDWIKVRERINKDIAVSVRIETGVMYKDILFGNTHSPKYTRYALVQSANYQNIPRSIQNVFLNTKLDADFVKNTIINSMNDEDRPIDVQTYRRLVTDFEQEYDEIDCWFRQKSDGTYPVRQLAEKIAEQGRVILAVRMQQREVWQKLNYVVDESKRQIPQSEEEVKRLNEKINKEHLREQQLTQDFQKEKDGLNQQIGAANAELKAIALERKELNELGIEHILQRAEQEAGLKQQAESKRKLHAHLLRTHETTEEKYKILRDNLNNELQTFENRQHKRLYEKQTVAAQKKEHLEVERTKQRNKLTADYQKDVAAAEERINPLRRDMFKAEEALKNMKTYAPKADEKQRIADEMQLLNQKEMENKARLETVKSQIAQHTNAYDLEEKALREKAQKNQQTLQAEREVCEQRIADIDEMLSRYKGSLYEWLEAHAEGWENTIGKVADEARVLYAQGLNPEYEDSESSNSLFGIRLNLDEIPMQYRSPDELKRQKAEQADEIRNLNIRLQQMLNELNSEVEKLKKHYTALLNPLRHEASALRVEIEQIPFRRQEQENRLHRVCMEENEMVEAEKRQREANCNQAVLRVKAEEDARKNLDNVFQKELNKLDAEFRKAAKNINAQIKDFESELNTETQKFAADVQTKIQDLDRQLKAELSGKGVDMNLLEQYQREIQELEARLKQIDDERALVWRYQRAVKEKFEKESEVRDELNKCRKKLEEIEQRYRDKRYRMDKNIKDLKDSLGILQSQLQRLQNGLELYEQMLKNECVITAELQQNADALPTNDDCQTLIGKLRGTVNQLRATGDTLKADVVKFNRNFKPHNAFNFNTTPVTDADYEQIAANLQEFLDYDKIETFRQRTSEHYKDIIGRISQEMGALLNSRSAVSVLINDINRDFVEKNFAGVIKSIELRADESSDRLMQLLIAIHDFTDENCLSIGELNLFSSANRNEVNAKVVDYLKSLAHQLQNEPMRKTVALVDTFRLQFRVKENDNDTNWVERINNVGSDGTDILVKAMVNIMLINVFKKKAARKSGGEFIIHCMMDEIGRLHPNNIKGILQFANSRNIYLINSSPTSYNPYDYKYTYMLSKQGVKTRVDKLMKRHD